MLCKQCNNEVSVLDDRCKYCGNDLICVDVERKYADVRQPSRIKGLNEKWADAGSLNKIEREVGGVQGVEPSWLKAHKEKWSGDFTAGGVSLSSKDVEELWDEVVNKRQRKTMIQELVGLIYSNPHLTTNPSYLNKASITDCYYAEEDMSVNACAGVDPDKSRPVITLYDGYINFMLAVEVVFRNKDYDLFVNLGETLERNKYKFSPEDLYGVVSDVPDKSVRIDGAFMAFFETIGHELGHVCLDHVLSPGYDDKPLDASRNQEREADSFASSLIASSIFKNHLFKSHLKCCVAWAVVEKVGGRVEPFTHPLALERLRNAVRNNREVAKKMDIDEAWVEKIFG